MDILPINARAGTC